MSAAAPAPDMPVSTIAEAIARMEAIEAALPETDVPAALVDKR